MQDNEFQKNKPNTTENKPGLKESGHISSPRKNNDFSEKTRMVDISEITGGVKKAKTEQTPSAGIGKIKAKIAAKLTLKSTLFILKKIATYALNIFLTVLLVGIITGAVVGVAFVIYINNYIDTEYNGLDNLKFTSSTNTTLYYVDDTGNEVQIDSLYGSENRLWAEYDSIPTNLINAYVAIEDQRFWEHNGVDTKRTLSAVYNFFIPTRSSYGGGSTITQQLIKNVTGENETTIQRKVQEIFRAMNVTEKFSKKEVLEMYLNTIYLSQNANGVRSAAKAYFGKDISELNLVECAALAAIAKSPIKYDPIINPKFNLERRNLVLKQMLTQKYITQEEFDKAYDAPLVLNQDGNVEYKETVHSYYVDTVIKDVIKALQETNGCDETTASRLLYSGGLKIITCIDPVVQSAMEEVYKNDEYWPESNGIKAQSAMCIMDPHNGNLLGIVGGRGEKTVSLGLNRATQSMRQCGSSIKPLSVYTMAIDKGIYTYGSSVDDIPTVYDAKNKEYWPTNANRPFRGKVSLKYAIAQSLNTVAVATLQQLGTQTVYDNLVNNMGFTTLNGDDDGDKYSDITLAPLALGAFTQGVTVREMTQGYGVLANGGVFNQSRTFTKVLDNMGNTLIDNTNEQKIVFKDTSAYIMTSLLFNVVKAGGTGAAAIKLDDKFTELEVAGKTGSTNDNKDIYYCGYTPDYVGCSWYGYDNPKTISTKIVNPAAKAWDAVMTKVYTYLKTNGIAYQEKFDTPVGIVKNVEFCSVSGMKPTEACVNDYCYKQNPGSAFYNCYNNDGVYTKNTVPTEECNCHKWFKFDNVTHALCLPGDNCPPESLSDISLRLVTGREFVQQIRIDDAQYVYQEVPEGYIYPTDPSVPFFQNLINGYYIGTSGTNTPINRVCIDHFDFTPDVSNTNGLDDVSID